MTETNRKWFRMDTGIYIYDQAEVLDFSGPFEVFLTSSRINASGKPFSVFWVSETGKTVTARAGVRVIPPDSLKQVSELHGVSGS